MNPRGADATHWDSGAGRTNGCLDGRELQEYTNPYKSQKPNQLHQSEVCGRTNRARDGEADDAAHEHAVLETVEEVRSPGVQRQDVLKERVSHQVSIEVRREHRLHRIKSRKPPLFSHQFKSVQPFNPVRLCFDTVPLCAVQAQPVRANSL